VVQSDVLDTIDSPQLAVYVVWEPILRTDDERGARKATRIFRDERVRNYWTDKTDLGKAFQKPLGLEAVPAWDVYLVYPPGVTWDGDSPPAPVLFQHQLRGRLPDAQLLDGPSLAEAIRRLLAK
jgi:hypothetical protein